MEAEIMRLERECTQCASIQMFLMKKAHLRTLFPPEQPPKPVGLSMHGAFPDIPFVFILVIAGPFTGLTQIIPPCPITAYDIPSAFH